MKRNGFHSLMCAWTAAAIVTGGCRTPAGTRVAVPRLQADPNTPAAIDAATTPSGRPQIAIATSASEGQNDGKLTVETRDPKVAAAQATATALTPGEAAALHARMEPLPDLAIQNAGAPTLRAPTPAPARPGPVQPIAFVVPAGKPVSDAPVAPAKWNEPLAEPQITPLDEIRSASEIRVRFSEPMVPVAAVGTPAGPVAKITPAVAGTWRWIDTRVATFTTAAPRLPQATDFTVTVPAGIKAVSGATLMADSSEQFSTAPIAIAGGYPDEIFHATSPIVVKLDQDFEPAKLLPFLRVTRLNSDKVLPHKVVTLADAQRVWAANPTIQLDPAKLDAALGKHYVVLAPQAAWPVNTTLQVSLKPGAPSREGPRVSRRRSGSPLFKVAPPFTVRGVTCGDLEKPRMSGAVCPVNGRVRVHFSMPIAESSYRAEKVQIDGEAFADNKPYVDRVDLNVPDRVGRAYSITIGDGLVDAYGQPYVGARKLGFVSGPPRFTASLQADTGMHVLDPRFAIPQWLVYSAAIASMRVQLFAVQPRDYFAYEQLEAGKRAVPPGRRVFDRTYTVGPNHEVDARVDLRPALNAAGLGHVVAVATAQPIAAVAGRVAATRPLAAQIAWLQVTKLGVSSRIDRERVNAWVQDISPDHRFLGPVGGATVSLLAERRGESGASVSDAAGHAQVELFPKLPRKQPATATATRFGDDDDDDEYDGEYYGHRPALLHARTGTDSTFAVVDRHEQALRVENALWYVTDDRFMYKPDEKVYVKGWVRWTHNGVNPDLSLPRPGEAVGYEVADAKGTRIASGQAKLTDQGGFHIEIELPHNINLGTAHFTLSTRKESYHHPFEVQEFRTPAYAVTLDDDVSHSGAIPLVLGERIEMTASAQYYSGGGLPGAAVQWDASLQTTSYAPPGWDLFTFAQRSDRARPSLRESAKSSLSGSSTSTVTYGIAALPDARTSLLEVDATVTDVDRTSIRARSRPILVHPSACYVGLRLVPRTYDTLEVIVTDLDGNAAPGVAITVDLVGVLGSERHREDARVIDTQTCKLTSAAAPVTCPFKRKDHQLAYTARARVADARGRTNTAQLVVPWWAAGDQEDLQVVPDKELYRPGEVAKVDIRSQVFPATAVVSFTRRGIISQRPIALAAASTIVELPIEAALIPNLHVTVDRYGKRPDTLSGSTLPLPAHAQAEAKLAIDLEGARLALRTRSTKQLVQPGEDATFEAFVQHAGKPVAGAEVALMVVDEAVLALTARSHADPLEPFYRHMANGTTAQSSLDTVHDSGDDLAGGPGITRTDLRLGTGRWGTIGHGSGSGSSSDFGSGRGGMRGRSGPVAARKDFRANAVFSPVLVTDSQGRVAVTVKMPDSLTRFRIVALATSSGRYFGKAESTIVTQRKVNARTVAPRFLTQGDRFSLPIVVQNLDRSPRTIEVAVRAANLDGVGPAGKRVTVPAGQRTEVRFDFATQARGRAVVQTLVSSGDFADASNVEIPVYEPATTESFATYGVIGAGAGAAAAPGAGSATEAQFEQLVVPPSIFTDVGGVEVELASTQLASLTDAYWYLYRYPYECAEQRSGRMLATAALYDLLDAFATPGRPTRPQIEAMRAKDAIELGKTQRADGGWGYFHGTTSDPFVTQQVLGALVAQKITGKVTAQALGFVTRESNRLFARLEQAAARPADRRLDRAEHPYLVSLAAATLTSLGAAGPGAAGPGAATLDVRGRAERLHALATTLASYPIDAKARVLALLADPRAGDRARPIRGKLLAELLAATHETAAAATVTAQYVEAERLLLVSSTRTTALALDAIMREAPGHAVVPKLARGVLDGRRHGRWRSTQENLVALQTMRRYFDTYEKVTPNYTGKLWFGAAAYTEHAFAGRTSTRAVARANWSQLAPGSTHDLALVKQGPGRMYYRVGITYAPRQTDVPALDAGFIVRRSYSAAGDPADVVRTPDGYQIRLGAKVLVTLELLATTRRHAVALVDPLPAGFESVNANLATAERALAVAGDARWDHVNMRDNRTEAFQLDVREGTHRFSYTVRATTPGTFIAAPAKAEEMYSPETFGRSNGLKVVIE